MADRARGDGERSEPGRFVARQPEGRRLRRSPGEGLAISFEHGGVQRQLAVQVRPIGRKLSGATRVMRTSSCEHRRIAAAPGVAPHGQTVEWPYGYSDDRSGSEKLT